MRSIEKLINKQYILAVLAILICAYYSFSVLHTSTTVTSKETPQQVIMTSQSPQPSEETSTSPYLPAKNSLLMNTLHATNQSGVVYKSPNVQVEYVASDDIFQAEILTTQITQAKQETEDWFHENGLSQEDLCDLPLLYYITGPVKEKLHDEGLQVNLLPEGC